jgi:hypothetical protein
MGEYKYEPLALLEKKTEPLARCRVWLPPVLCLPFYSITGRSERCALFVPGLGCWSASGPAVSSVRLWRQADLIHQPACPGSSYR